MRIRTISALVMTALATQVALAQDRMPPLTAEQMTEAQRQAVAEMPESLRRGPGVILAFTALLRSPELMLRFQKTGEYLVVSSDALDRRIVELMVLLVARQWTQQFVWRAHYPVALKAGVKPDTVQAIAEGRRPASMAEDEAIAYDFFEELFRTRGVSDPTYSRAVQRFSERGVIDMVGLGGYYTWVAMVFNVARTSLPPQLAEREPLMALPR